MTRIREEEDNGAARASKLFWQVSDVAGAPAAKPPPPYTRAVTVDVKLTVISDASTTHEVWLVADEDDGSVVATVMS